MPAMIGQKFLEHFSQGVIAIDEKFKVACINPSIVRNAGVQEDSIIGSPLASVLKTPISDSTFSQLKAGKGVKESVFINLGALKGYFRAQLDPIIEEGAFNGIFLTFDPSTPLTWDSPPPKVQENENKFRTLLENSLDLFALHNPDASFSYISPSIRNILGWEPEKLLGTDPFAFIHSDDHKYVKQIFSKVIGGNSINKSTFQIKHAEGHFLWFETHFSPIFNEKGELSHIQTVSRDITQEQETKELLEEAQEIAQIGGWTYYPENDSYIFSKKTHEIYGVGYEETFDKEKAIKHYALEHQPIIRQAFDALVKYGKPFDKELRFFKGLKKPIWVRVIGKPYYESGKIQKVGGAIQDITGQKAAQLEREQIFNQLRESEEKFRALAEKSLVGVYLFKEDNIEYANPRLSEITGYSIKELYQNVHPQNLVHPEDHELFRRNVKRRLSGEKASINYEFRLVTKSGDIRNVEVFGGRINLNGQYAIMGTLLDKTESKKAKENLLENQYFTQKVMDHSPILIHVYDYENFQFIYSNQRIENNLGYSAEEINQMPRGIEELIYPGDLEKVYEAYSKNFSLKDGEVNEVEFRIQNKWGRWRWMVSRDTPFKRNDNGQLKQVLSTVQDITEQKEKEQEVIEKQQFIESVTSQTPHIINIFDVDEKDTIFENRNLFKQLGYSGEEIERIRSDLKQLYHPKDLPHVIKYHKEVYKLKDEEVKEIEFRLWNKAGYWTWLLNKDVVFKRKENGAPKQFLGVIQDITEQKEAWKALERSETLFRQLFDNAPVGIVMLDHKGIIKSTNQAFRKIFSYSEEEIEKIGSLRGLIIPDNKTEEAREVITNTLKGKQIFKESVRTDRDGNPVPVFIYGVPVSYEGQPINIFNIYVDISNRKKAEDDLKKQTEELLKSNAELEQFAYVTSHNLRSPVVNLQSLLQLFDASEVKDENNTYILEKIHQSVNQLGETLNDLIQIVAQKKEVSTPREKIKLKDIVDKIRNQLAEKIREEEATIETDFSEVPDVYYLRGFMESILQNLITNAIKYRSPGRKPHIKIETQLNSNEVCLKVADNGQGIDLKRYNDRLFKLYQKFDTNKRGKGMGLYLVKTQVESLGGTIDLESEVGSGTTFYLYLNDANG